MTFGTKVGRAIGVVGALAVEGTVRGATGLGRFGQDVVAGAEAGYTERSAQLRITREAKTAARNAALAALAAPVAMPMAPATVEPAPVARRRRAAEA